MNGSWLWIKFDPKDITTYPTARSIFESGLFTPWERGQEYKRRGKGPAGVISGRYSDTYLYDGDYYSDFSRD